jgi:hypothetical protein
VVHYVPALATPEVAKLLLELGQRTALRGGNPYRARAYTRAAENLMALTEPLEDLVAQGRLKEIPGVGYLPTGPWITRMMFWRSLILSSQAFTAVFKLSRKEQTDRILRAVANPRTTILGHMTGRHGRRKNSFSMRRARGRGRDQR